MSNCYLNKYCQLAFTAASSARLRSPSNVLMAHSTSKRFIVIVIERVKSTGNLNHQSIWWYRHGIFMVFSKANTKYTLQVLHGSHLCSTICKSSLAVNVVVSMQWHFSILTSSINCVREPFNKDFNNVIMLTSSASERNSWHLIKIGIWGMCAGKCLVRYEVW